MSKGWLIKRYKNSLFGACMVAWLSILSYPSQSATVTHITSDDTTGYSSFNSEYAAASTYAWDDNLAPHAGADYVTTKAIRTPNNGTTNYTFAGDSLTLSGGLLAYKGGGSGYTITVNNLYLKGGSVQNWTSYNYTLAGSIILTSGYNGYLQISGTNASFSVASQISGTGALTLNTSSLGAMSANSITLNGSSANTYTGGTVIGQYAYVIAAASGAFSTGNINLTNAKLELQNSSTIADSASLILTSVTVTDSIIFNFTGTEVLSGLSLNGVSLAIGTYTSTQLDTYFSTTVFAGTGSIQVIPEPSTVALMLAGILLFAVWGWKRTQLCQSKSA